MEKTIIKILPKGPALIEGDLTIIHTEGESKEDALRIAICRCGYSKNKPFCDGAHKSCPVVDEL